MINPITGNRMEMVSQDAQTGDEVARRDTMPAEQSAATPKGREKSAKQSVSEEAARKQPGLKLPLQGGRKTATKAEQQPTEAAKSTRSRAKASYLAFMSALNRIATNAGM